MGDALCLRIGGVNRSASAWLAWSIWVFCAVLTALALILIVLNGSEPNAEYESSLTAAAIALALLGFPTVGATVASRRPGNAIGWLFCAVGFFSQVGIFSEQYVIYALLNLLRDETDLDALSDELVAVVRDTMHPEHVSFWLRPETSPKGEQTN